MAKGKDGNLAHCPACGRSQPCETVMVDCLTTTMTCTVCGKTWREEADI